MRRSAYVLVFMMFFSLLAVVFAGSFKVYPGAKAEDVYEPDQSKAVPQMQKIPKVIIFTTNDFFENVVSFYRSNAKEYRMPGMAGKSTKLSSGQELREAYFILDKAGDITTSKHWINIQRPYLSRERTNDGFQGKYGAIRDVTAIIEEDRRGFY